MKDNVSFTPYLFAFLSVLLLALTVWVIWEDEIQLRPWKSFQKEYRELKEERLQDEYEQAKAKFERSGNADKLRTFQAKLDEAVKVFQSPEIQAQYAEQVQQLELVEASLEQNLKSLQEKRGKYLEAEYLYIRYQKDENKNAMGSLQEVIDGLNKNREALLEKRMTIEDAIGELTAEKESLGAEIRELNKGLDDKLAAIESAERMDGGIKQIHIKDADKADRCITCHIGIESSYHLTDRQPLTPHPARFLYLENHPVSEFGCTFCHRGQGRATTSPDKAHGWVEHWTEPMLYGRMTQASCLACHNEPDYLRGAEFLAEGSKLIKKYGCYGCHMIPGYEDLREIGPILADVGTKVNYSWAVKWLQDPKSYYDAARMPKFYFSKEEAESIADYLFSLTGTSRKDVFYSDNDIDWDLADEGKAIWRQSRCNICHATNNMGGAHAGIHAPDLGKVGSKVNKEWLFNWIKNPKKYFPETKMPRYRFSDEEVAALVEYIVSEFQDWDFEPEYEEAAPIKVESIEKGQALVEKYGCFGCHKLRGMEDMQNIAPQLLTAGATVAGSETPEKIGAELSSIGSKSIELLDFGKLKGKIPHNRESYVQQKLRDSRSYRDNLLMPDFHLTEEEIRPLSAVLLGFTDASLPLRFVLPGNEKSNFLEEKLGSHTLAGEFALLADDVKCLNCHKIKGDGYDFAPDLTIAGSKLQEKWLRQFLDQPDVIRPMLKQMPRFNLAKQLGMVQGNLKPVEIETVLNYVKTELVDDEIPLTLPEFEETPAEQKELGRQLYDEKGCVACHQIGSDGGTAGPNLTNVGDRLTTGFVFKYLEDPRRYSPDNVEPVFGFTERERVYLTRYLMSLKKQEPSNVGTSEARSDQ